MEFHSVHFIFFGGVIRVSRSGNDDRLFHQMKLVQGIEKPAGLRIRQEGIYRKRGGEVSFKLLKGKNVWCWLDKRKNKVIS